MWRHSKKELDKNVGGHYYCWHKLQNDGKESKSIQLILSLPKKCFNCQKFIRLLKCSRIVAVAQPKFTCSKLTIETLEQGVKYVQS